MKFFSFLILFFTISNIYSQKNNIINIHFSYQNAINVGSKIEIFFCKENDNEFSIYVRKYKSEYKYLLNFEKVTSLINAVYKISPMDVLQKDRNILDCSETKIEFSSSIPIGNSVTYTVYCLNNNEEITSWRDYLKAVNLILDLAKLKFSDLKN